MAQPRPHSPFPDPYFDHFVLAPQQHHRLYLARQSLSMLEGAISHGRRGDVGCSTEELSGFLSLVLEQLDEALNAQPMPGFVAQHPRR